MALALLGVSLPASAMAEGAAAQNGKTATDVGEIVVTAQRRSERLIDVPYNISAVTSSTLSASGTTNANDIAKVIVGLGADNEGPAAELGNTRFTLRGLRTDALGEGTIHPKNTVNAVSTYFGDSPLFFSLLMKDLDRVEVLRGPQGTLYGSGAEGGTIRFIPNRPSFDRVSGNINASAGSTYNSKSANGSIDGVINVPLADNLAVRLVGAYTHQAGFIDKADLFAKGPDGIPIRSIPSDLTSGPTLAPVQHAVNNSYQYLLRGAIRYEPTSWLDMELNYIHQKTHADDEQYTNPTYPGGFGDNSFGKYPNAAFATRPGGKLTNTTNQLEPVTATLDLVSGSINASFGGATLTSVTTYSQSKTHSNRDTTFTYIHPGLNYIPLIFRAYPDFTGPANTDVVYKDITQEIRLVSAPDKPITYVLGAYYELLKDRYVSDLRSPGLEAFAQFLGQPGANPQAPYTDADGIFFFTTRASDLAAFGELTWHPTDKWQITGGFRVFKDEVHTNHVGLVPFLGAGFGNGVTPGQSLGASGADITQNITDHIFKLNTSYDIMQDTKVYATYSRGFRRGGANPVGTAGTVASLPGFQSYKPDFADNYEIGLKGLAFDHQLTYSLSAYVIELKNFQIDSTTPAGVDVVLNGPLARSKGVEAELTYQPDRNLSLSLGYTYIDAKVIKGLTVFDLKGRSLQTNPPNGIIVQGTTILPGARLPGVSRDSLLAAADYSIPVGGDRAIILHGDVNYRSSQLTTIDATAPAFTTLPSSTMADARVTYDSGEHWTASVFVTNLTNAIGYTSAAGILTSPNLYQKWLISTPRTFGVDLHYDF